MTSAVNLCLGSSLPSMVWWERPEYTMFYNDACLHMFGRARYDRWFGGSGRECWADAWDRFGPAIDRVFDTGEPQTVTDIPITIERHLPIEEAHFTLSHAPIWATDGHVAGVLTIGSETTARVIAGEQRLALQILHSRIRDARTPEEACTLATEAFAERTGLLPFALLYLRTADGEVRLAATTAGVDASLAPEVIHAGSLQSPWPMLGSALERRGVVVEGGERRPAMVLPLCPPGDAAPVGFLVAGVNPRRVLDEQYREFLEMAAGTVAAAIVHAQTAAALERERELRLGLEGFIATLSHELRSVLQAIGMAVVMVRRGVESARAVDVLDRQIAHTGVLVDDLLDISRIARGKIDLRWERFDLREVVHAAIEQVQVSLMRADVTLLVDTPVERLEIHGDRVRLVQVLVNLLDNALKYTPAGGQVSVDTTRQDSALVVTVRDTGQGIPSEVLPHIFDLFVQARDGAGGGLGIGLALSAQLVHLHGGTIVAHSAGADQGSEFVVTLPAAI
jgi:signal transduction histidine kinase